MLQLKDNFHFNEMNTILNITFIVGSLIFDSNENILNKKYQSSHHRLVANAKTIEIGKKYLINLDLVVC